MRAAAALQNVKRGTLNMKRANDLWEQNKRMGDLWRKTEEKRTTKIR